MMENSFTAYRDKDGHFSKNATLSLCDLPRLRSFVAGDYSLGLISSLKLISCHYGIILT